MFEATATAIFKAIPSDGKQKQSLINGLIKGEFANGEDNDVYRHLEKLRINKLYFNDALAYFYDKVHSLEEIKVQVNKYVGTNSGSKILIPAKGPVNVINNVLFSLLHLIDSHIIFSARLFSALRDAILTLLPLIYFQPSLPLQTGNLLDFVS